MRLQQEKNEVEAELARVPTNNPGRKLQVGLGEAGLVQARLARVCICLTTQGHRQCKSARVCPDSAGTCMQLPRLAHRTCPSVRPQDRRRKGELEQRLEVVNREVSAIRLQLKKMGYK